MGKIVYDTLQYGANIFCHSCLARRESCFVNRSSGSSPAW